MPQRISTNKVGTAAAGHSSIFIHMFALKTETYFFTSVMSQFPITYLDSSGQSGILPKHVFFYVISIRIPNLYRMLLNDSLLMKIMGIPSGNMLFSRRISISRASHKASFPVRGTMGVLLGFHGFCRTDWAHYFHEYVTSLSVFFPHFHCAYHYPLQFLPWSMVKSCGFWAGQTLFSNTWPFNSWNMFH